MHYIKLFQSSDTGMTLDSFSANQLQNSKGNFLSGGIEYTGMGKLAIFDRNRRLSRKRCKTGPWLLRITNM